MAKMEQGRGKVHGQIWKQNGAWVDYVKGLLLLQGSLRKNQGRALWETEEEARASVMGCIMPPQDHILKRSPQCLRG